MLQSIILNNFSIYIRYLVVFLKYLLSEHFICLDLLGDTVNNFKVKSEKDKDSLIG